MNCAAQSPGRQSASACCVNTTITYFRGVEILGSNGLASTPEKALAPSQICPGGTPMIETRVLLDPAVWQGKIYSNGWRTAAGGATDVTDKSTGAALGRTGVANAADIAEAAKRAKAALPAWRATPAAKRAEILRKAADLLEAAQDEVAGFDVRETGGFRPKADFEVGVAVGELREAAGLCEAAGERRVIDKNDEVESVALRVPIGVVGVISP